MMPVTLTEAERQRVDQVDALVSRGPSGVTALLGMLGDPSWTVRRAVTSSLASLGDDAVAPLCSWLIEQRSSEAAIAAAIDSLAASMSSQVPAAVSQLLWHRTPAIAADAAIILGRYRASAAVPALAETLSHPDDNVAMAAIEALGAIGDGSIINPLISVLEGGNFFRVFPALQVLSTTSDPRAVAAIAKLVDDPMYRDDAVRALGRTGSPLAVPALAKAFGHSPTKLIARALADLLELSRWQGAEAPVTAELVAQFAEHRDAFAAVFRSVIDRGEEAAVITVLGVIGDPSTAVELAGLIEQSELRAPILRALAQGAKRDPAVVVALSEVADPRARALALDLVTARASIGTALAALSDEDADVRARACAALARLAAVEAVPKLFELLADPDPRVPHAASAAIDSLGTSEARALASRAARSANPQVRRYALRIVGYLGVADAYELVEDALSIDDDRVRAAAISLLGVIEDPRAPGKLAQLAVSADEHLRIAAVRAAARRGGPEMALLLARGLGDDSAWVRYHACQGLGLAGESSTATLLIGRLADPMPHVRIAAIEALARMQSPLAWQTLCSFAQSDDSEMKRVALAGLALHDPDAALPFLMTGLASNDLATQLVALSGLARARAPEALAATTRAAHSSVVEIRDAAVSLLAERTDPAGAAAFVELAITAPPEHPARGVLGQPSSSRVTAIAERLATADVGTAQRLAGALGAMGEDAGAIAALFAQLASQNPAARRAAASVLAANRVPAAAAVISKLAETDPDPEVRAICAVLG